MSEKKRNKNYQGLAGTRLRMLQWIHEYKSKHDYSPSNREMCQALAVPGGSPISTSVCRYHLGELQNMGYIDFIPKQARTVHLTALGKAYLQAHSLPARIRAKQEENKAAHADIDALLLQVDELVPA